MALMGWLYLDLVSNLMQKTVRDPTVTTVPFFRRRMATLGRFGLKFYKRPTATFEPS